MMSISRITCTAAFVVVATLGQVVSTAHSQQAASPRGGDVWGRNYFPNIELTSQDGKTYRFFDDLIEGKVVLINFIYTSCPDSCPLETAGLKQVQDLLGDRVGQDVFFYSITIDPEVDTVEVLKKYTTDYHVGPGWLFLTGKASDIELLRRKLGLYMDEIAADGSRDHNLSLMMGNQATGRWMKRSPFESPYVLADQVGSWLSNWKNPSPQADNDYAEAPQLRDITKGESLFRTRCQVCHDIGTEMLPMEARLKKVGPDLLDVGNRRERAWLHRWLKEPDEVMAEGDSIALGLRAAYGVAMPNMQLNDTEIEALLEHIDSVSAEVHERQRLALAPDEDGPHTGTTVAPCCAKKMGLAAGEPTLHDDGHGPLSVAEGEALEATGPAAAGGSGGSSAGESPAPQRWLGLSLGHLATVGLGLAFGLVSCAIGLRRWALAPQARG